MLKLEWSGGRVVNHCHLSSPISLSPRKTKGLCPCRVAGAFYSLEISNWYGLIKSSQIKPHKSLYNPHCLHYQLHDFEGYLTHDLIQCFYLPLQCLTPHCNVLTPHCYCSGGELHERWTLQSPSWLCNERERSWSCELGFFISIGSVTIDEL
jgi:hypothetical protein